MIFVAVGTQLPFDRLVRYVDNWSAQNEVTVIGQIGDSELNTQFMVSEKFFEPSRFRDLQNSAEILVGHAGIGTILGALELQKPLIIMPRRADLGEHRNDHQVATATLFHDRPGIYVANTEEQLIKFLDDRENLARSASVISKFASRELIETITKFIHGNSY